MRSSSWSPARCPPSDRVAPRAFTSSRTNRGAPRSRTRAAPPAESLGDTDGPVSIPGTGWAWAYPLQALGGHHGHLVVSAPAQPSDDEQFLIRTRARQAGTALGGAAQHRSERTASQEPRERVAELASVNQELTRAVSDLERRTRTHTSLMNVDATGGGAREIAGTLNQLTGLVVVVEDKFGNPLGWAGGQQPAQRSRGPPATAPSC